MSDSADKTPAPPPPPKPTPKTSTVPLKKETVRITLRAKPPSGDTAVVPPVAPMQPSAAAGDGGEDKTATVPVAHDKTATVPVVQDKTATAPTAPGAPAPPAAPGAPAPPAAPTGAKTVPLAKPPAAPAGAKTIPLAKAPPTGATPVAGKRTTPLQPGAGAVKPLPKATVQLQKTQAMAGSPTASIQKGPAAAAAIGGPAAIGAIGAIEIEEEEEEPGIMPYAIIVLVLAIIVLAIELLTKFV